MSIGLAITTIAAAAIAAAGACFVGVSIDFVIVIASVIVITAVGSTTATLLVLHAGGNRHRKLFFLGDSAHHHACRFEDNIVHTASCSIPITTTNISQGPHARSQELVAVATAARSHMIEASVAGARSSLHAFELPSQECSQQRDSFELLAICVVATAVAIAIAVAVDVAVATAVIAGSVAAFFSLLLSFSKAAIQNSCLQRGHTTNVLGSLIQKTGHLFPVSCRPRGSREMVATARRIACGWLILVVSRIAVAVAVAIITAALVGPIVFQTAFLGFRLEPKDQRVVVLGFHFLLQSLSLVGGNGNRLNVFDFLVFFRCARPLARGKTLRSFPHLFIALVLFQFGTKAGRHLGSEWRHGCRARLLFQSRIRICSIQICSAARRTAADAGTVRVGFTGAHPRNIDIRQDGFLGQDDRKIFAVAKRTRRLLFLLGSHLQEAFGAHAGMAARGGINVGVHQETNRAFVRGTAGAVGVFLSFLSGGDSPVGDQSSNRLFLPFTRAVQSSNRTEWKREERQKKFVSADLI